MFRLTFPSPLAGEGLGERGYTTPFRIILSLWTHSCGRHG